MPTQQELDQARRLRMEEARREALRRREQAAASGGIGASSPGIGSGGSIQRAAVQPFPGQPGYSGNTGIGGGAPRGGYQPQTTPVTEQGGTRGYTPTPNWSNFVPGFDPRTPERRTDEARWAGQQPPNQRYGYNPTRGGGTFEKAWSDYSNLPTLSDQLNTAPNPMDYYSGLGPDAQNAIGGYLRGRTGGFDPNANPYLNQGRDYMNNAPPLPGAPGFGMNPDSYRGPSALGYRGPEYDEMSFGSYDGSGVTGPRQGQFSDPRAGAAGIGGPQTDYERLYASTQGGPINRVGQFGPMGAGPGREAMGAGPGREAMGAGPGREAGGVAREGIGPSGYRTDETFADPRSVSQRAYEAGLGGAIAAQGTDFNTDIYKQGEAALQDSLRKAGLRSTVIGQEEVGGRGMVYDPSTGVSQEAFAKYYAPEQGRIGEALANLSERQASEALNARMRGSEMAAGIGGSAAGAAAEFGRLGQQESQFGGEMALRQRQQDIDQQGQRITERGQDIGRQVDEYGQNVEQRRQDIGRQVDEYGQNVEQRRQDINRQLEGRGQDVTARGQDVEQRNQDIRQFGDQASRALDVERLRGENYQQQTQRMTGIGSLVNEMESARANNDVAGYNAATQRLQTEYGYSSDQARNQIAGHQAATQRGEVGQQAWAESNRLGLDYQELQQGWDALAASNVNARNVNLVDVMRITGDQANERIRTVTGAMGDYGRTLQEGQIENMRNVYQQASMAAGVMQDTARSSEFWTNAIMQATGQDREAYIRMWETWVGDQTHRNDNKFDWGGFAGDVIGANAQIGSAMISSGGMAAASDKNIKSAVEPIDGRVILERLHSLPVSSWVYNERPDVRHVGPMAQDFKLAFGLGDSDKVIGVVDALGVLMAAVKELTGQVRELRNNAGLN